MATHVSGDLQVDGKSVVLGLAAAKRVAGGEVVGTATFNIVTGMGALDGYAVGPVAATASTANAGVAVTFKESASTPGTINVKRWKHSGVASPTLVNATAAGTVSWVAVGL